LKVGLLIIGHGAVGPALIEAAEFILGESLSIVNVVSIVQSGSQTPDEQRLGELVEELDKGAGVLVLTDLQGATPCNLISKVTKQRNRAAAANGRETDICAVVSGLNLAMLLRVWNYRDKPLDELSNLAVGGGQRGIGIIQ
jgi:PTS system ascorbate-specific IIA component